MADVVFVFAWLAAGACGASLTFKDWTSKFDMDWGIFASLCLLALTGPFCLLFGLMVVLGDQSLPKPKFFKRRESKEQSE